MNKKQLIIIWVIISMIVSGCAPAYKFKYGRYGANKEEGYVVLKGNHLLSEFTQDELGGYPKDLKLAKKRFRRRREVVEKYYKETEPELFDNFFMMTLKTLLSFVVYPFIVLAKWYRETHPLEKEKEIDKEGLKRYIEEDCRKES